MTASIDIIVAQLFLAMLAFNLPAYHIQRWHVFLAYQILNGITTLYNLLVLRRTPWTHNIGCKLRCLLLVRVPKMSRLEVGRPGLLARLDKSYVRLRRAGRSDPFGGGLLRARKDGPPSALL
ncbi:MAG: hypothetical protein Q9207_005509 [Kuettlingeria erythrocarpa]